MGVLIQYVILQNNTLTANNPPFPSDRGTFNTLHNPNTTNIHTHGLHITSVVSIVFAMYCIQVKPSV